MLKKTNGEENIVTAGATAEENGGSDLALRPKKLTEYVGQQQIKRTLSTSIQAAQGRDESLDHILLYGPPGLGKTTLAMIIAREMGVNIKTTTGPAIEKSGDLAAILTNLKEGDVLFIDEIHRLRRAIEEILYPAMEDGCLDIMIGSGPAARSMKLNLPPFTLIGATTKAASLSGPLRDRFGNVFKLEFYTEEEISQIVERSAGLLEVEISSKAAEIIATRSRRTPRIANRILRRIRDWTQVHGSGKIDETATKEGLASLQIDELGLTPADLELLQVMIEKFGGGPVGLNTLGAALSEEQETIEDVYEPYLIQLGMIDRTPRGRVATDRAYQHLGIKKVG